MNNPADYEKHKTVGHTMLNHHVPKILEKLEWKEGESILDYGCGAGSVDLEKLLPLTKSRGSKLIGVDRSAAMIDHARSTVPLSDGEHVKFVMGDITTTEEGWPLANQKFDKVFSFNVIHFIEDIATFMKKIYGQLSDNGVLAGFVWLSPKAEIFSKIQTSFPLKAGQPKIVTTTLSTWARDVETGVKTLKEAIVQSGFTVKEFEPYEIHYAYPDVYGLVELMKTAVNPASLAQLKETDQLTQFDRFMAETLANLLQMDVDAKPFNLVLQTYSFILQKKEA